MPPVHTIPTKRPTTPRLPLRALLLPCLLASGLSCAAEETLTVKLQGIRDNAGQIRVSIYSDEASFRKEDKALQVITLPASPGEMELVFRGVAPGRYALMAYHDENADNRLNLRFGMFPTEGYGLSNNPKVMGPPKFNESAFDVAGPETSVNISIYY